MIKIFVLIALLFADINCYVTKRESEDELLAVAVFFRHGDRTPKSSFPTDEVFNAGFSEGAGHLTNKGIDRHYRLGQWLRNRYTGFLPEKFSPEDILVRSTDVDRTLMSAAANLAGLYPPKDDLVWNNELLWRPIPIHTLPKEDDAVLAMKKPCPKLKKLYKKQKKSDVYAAINEKYADLYEYVAQNTGVEATDISDIKLVRSVFYCYKSMNSSFIPAWADALNQTDLDYLAALAYQRHTVTEKMKRLRAGPFLHVLINYFENAVDRVEDTPKFAMFSSHDSNVVSILDAMGVYDFYPPNFAATIIWELRRGADGQGYVRLFYRKSEEELLSLVVPGCQEDCVLDEFKSLLKPVTAKPKKWKEKCEVEDDDDLDLEGDDFSDISETTGFITI